MSEPPPEGDLSEQIRGLSPAQRTLLERRLMAGRATAAKKRVLTAREEPGPVPLSHAQELLWLLSQVFDGGVAYNAPGAFRLEGPLDLDVLDAALAELAQRHEILRTTYAVIDGMPMQVVGTGSGAELRLVDLSTLDPDLKDAEVGRILKLESRFSFDLEHGPIMRPTIIRLGPEEHVFMLVLHHVATDGYSRGVLYRELTVLYEAIATGRRADLEPLPVQYADYAVWHRRWLDGGVADAQLAYWAERLAGSPSRLDLPADHARPAVRSYVGDHMSLPIDIPTREELRGVARGQDATLFVGLLAVFATLLQRYSGQDDVVVGTPFAGRNRRELEQMVGYFINPLALRLDLSGDPTFRELVTRCRETTLGAFAHADVPYEMVVRKTYPERDLSQTPVFQSMLVLHNPAWQTHRPTFEPPGIRATELVHEKGWAKFDILLGISERTGGLNTTWEYSTELFQPATVARMMAHFRTLAESAALDPDRRVSRLSMLTESERGQVLNGWNPKTIHAPRGDSFKRRFESQARSRPDAVAVICGEQRWTFGELNRRANRLAWRLKDEGVGPGSIVGILMEKSAELVAAVVAVTKAGGAYLPLDPLYPLDRIEFMLAEAAPQVVLSDRDPDGPLPATDARIVHVEFDALAALSDGDPPTTAGDDDLAYVIYTSGSTGRPKGAMISNASLASAYLAYDEAYRLSELKCHLQMASFSFDVFTGDLVRSLLAGAAIVLCNLETTVDPPRLYELMVREGVDAAEFVPATAGPLFEYAEATGRRLDFMRLIVVSSEAWRTDRYEYFRSLCGPDTRIINAYGVTEATIDQTWYEPAPDAVLAPGRFMPIGGPLSNSRVYVLGPGLDPVPVSVPGELCIGGISVALGYLNRPELTAERFVSDPFSDEQGAVLYRTGDRARWLPDGTIEFLGRTDRQVKIRGFRIEPGEIESVLERHPSIKTAVVKGHEDEHGSARLVAYLVTADAGQSVAPSELRTLIAEHVPAYMIPAAWVFVDTLPVTPNGKVDLDALPDPEFDRAATAAEFVSPRTEAERQLAGIWSDVLDVQEIGVYDNFFALGGHSLLAVRLFSEIERRLGTRIPLAALFQNATIAGLAELVERDGTGDESEYSSTIVPMAADGDGPPFFLVGWVDGDLLGYRDLAAHWKGAPLYGLIAPGVDGKRLPITTIEEIAAHYVQVIRSFQPRGPYYFGGFCFAGIVSYEMARQLMAQGEEVGMAALIDSYWHGSRRPTRLNIEREKWAAFRSAGPRGKVTWVTNRLVRVRNRIRTEIYFRSGFAAISLMAMTGRVRKHKRWNVVTVAGTRAAKRYVPSPADLRIDFFRAQTGPSTESTPWERLALRGVTLREVIGPEMSHVTILKEPGVRTLAVEMTRVLDALIDGGSSNGAISSTRSPPLGEGMQLDPTKLSG